MPLNLMGSVFALLVGSVLWFGCMCAGLCGLYWSVGCCVGVGNDAGVMKLVNRPIRRDFSPPVRGTTFGRLKVSCTCITFSISPIGLGSTVRNTGSLGVGKFGIAVPRGVSMVRFLSRVSRITDLVNTIGAVSFGGLGKCGASKVNTIETVRRMASVGGGGIMITNTKNTSETVSFCLTGCNTSSVAVLGEGISETVDLTNSILSSKLVTRIGSSSVSRVGDCLIGTSVLISAAPVKVRPRISSRPVTETRGVCRSLIMFSTICGPGRAILVGRTVGTNTGPICKVGVLLCRNTRDFGV